MEELQEAKYGTLMIIPETSTLQQINMLINVTVQPPHGFNHQLPQVMGGVTSFSSLISWFIFQ